MYEICRVCLYDGPSFSIQQRLVDSEPHKKRSNDFVEDANVRFSDVLGMLTTSNKVLQTITNVLKMVLINVNLYLQPDPGDGLPQRICNDCATRVVDAYILRQQVDRSHRSLMEIRDRDPNTTKFNIIEDVIIVSKKSEHNDVEVYNVKTIKEPESLNRINTRKRGTVTTSVKIEPGKRRVDPSNVFYVPAAASNPDEEDGVSFLLSSLVEPLNAPDSKEKLKRSLVRRHECSVCNKSFTRKSNLVDHLRLHANMRPYECDICQATFVQAGNLRAHMRIHTKERPYECSICGKTYNQSGALKVHIRIHTNERNFKCDTCGKAFTNASDRNKHARVHDPNSQFRCQFCDRTFAQRINWRLHLKKYHSSQLSEQELNQLKIKTEVKKD